MNSNSIKSKRNKSGQILLEYVIMLVLLAVVALACIALFSVFSEYGHNVRKQVGIDSP